ncbi:MAG: 50S ribosomal protein L4 [Alphaproteobacteria bacterium]|nr:MAG: 50S ribosomal protein L4 [Alphaproteobacteria bacterium]
MKCEVITLDNKKAGEIDLDESIFGLPARKDILARMVEWQLARTRAGTHKAKGRSEVNGSNRKPWRQKGTGRARAGSTRISQFRGGGVIFGPTPRDHSIKLQKKVRRLALKTALSAKQAEGKLVILDRAAMDEGKTKILARALNTLGFQSVLFIDGPELDENFVRAASNIVGIDVLPQQGANVYDILRRDVLVLTKDAVSHLEARLK